MSPEEPAPLKNQDQPLLQSMIPQFLQKVRAIFDALETQPLPAEIRELVTEGRNWVLILEGLDSDKTKDTSSLMPIARSIDLETYLSSFYAMNNDFSPPDLHEVVVDTSWEIMMDTALI